MFRCGLDKKVREFRGRGSFVKWGREDRGWSWVLKRG